VQSKITADVVRALLTYNEATGELTWKPRSDHMFSKGKRSANAKCMAWNTSYANKNAGNLNPSLGYWQICIFGKLYRAHRVIWLMKTGRWPVGDIDHINLDKTDNSWANLREATRQQNSGNTKMRASNTSGFKGVSMCKWKRLNQYRAVIGCGHNFKHIGYFGTAEEAAEAYKLAAKDRYGDFARSE
jgi:hypothetical protein